MGMNQNIEAVMRMWERRPLYWKLDSERNVVPATRDEFCAMMDGPRCRDRIVAKTLVHDSEVSTVFLGLDHGYSPDPDAQPLTFETLVFGGALAGEMERCYTWAQAEASHARMIKRIEEQFIMDKNKTYPWYAWAILAAAIIGIVTIAVISFTGCSTPQQVSVNPAALRGCTDSDDPRCKQYRRQ